MNPTYKITSSNYSVLVIVIAVSAMFIASGPSSQQADAIGGTLDQTLCQSFPGPGVWSLDTCSITSSLTIDTDEILTIPHGVVLNIEDAATVTIESGGHIANSGTILNDGGIIINRGEIFNGFSGFINNQGILNNRPGAHIGNAGVIDSIDTINNRGTFGNGLGARLNINDGSVNINSDGILTIAEVATLNARDDSTININTGGILDVFDEGTVNVLNILDVNGGTVNINDATVNVTTISLLWVRDGGAINVAGGGNIYIDTAARLSIDNSTVSVTNGLLEIRDGGELRVNSGGTISLSNLGSSLIVRNSAEAYVNSGGTIDSFGGIIYATDVGAVYLTGGTVNIHGDSNGLGPFDIFDDGFLGVWEGGTVNIHNVRLGILNDGNTFVSGGTINVMPDGEITIFSDGLFSFSEGTVNVFCGGTIDDHGGSVAGTYTFIPCDSDSDGIADEVDTQPNIFSNDFISTDEVDVGIFVETTGTIETRGGQIVSIVDLTSPGGVRIIADISGAGSPAEISVCDGIAIYHLEAGNQAKVTCGSATTEVIEGPIDADFVGDDGATASATIPTGHTLTFDAEDFSFSAPESNPGPITITTGGNTVVVDAGETVQQLQVRIDIKPDGTPNTINVKKGKTVTVAMFGSSSFNVNSVDKSTLKFGGNNLQSSVKTVVQDVNKDGIMDLVMQFKVPPLGFRVSDTTGCITGLLQDGTPIMGCDSVRILNK